MAIGYSVGLAPTCIALALLWSASLSASLHHRDDSNMVVACPLSPTKSDYLFTRGIPEGCVQSDCDYFVGISHSTNEYLLDITLEGKAEGWLAVGFSKSPSMYRADVVGCSRHTSGLVAVIDTWNSEHFKFNTMKEPQDDICHYSAGYNNGRMHCSFSRTIRGSSYEYDYDLSDYYYLLFGSGQTLRNSFTAGFTYHSGGIPVVSESMVNPMLGKVVPVATATPAEEVVGGDQNLHVTTAVSSEAEVESSSTTTEPPAYKETSNCPPLTSRGPYRLTHQIPAGCDQSECDYFLGISSNRDNNDLLDFTLEGVAEGWIAVGFSKTPNMREADVLGCNVYSDGRVVPIDTWNPRSPKWNVLDNNQFDICSYGAETIDRGRLLCRFSRSIEGSSSQEDFNLDESYYLLFGRGQNPQMLSDGGFTYHDDIPTVSRLKINPVLDNDLSVELDMVTRHSACPIYTVAKANSSSSHRISHSYPKGCEHSDCDYFVGIDTNMQDEHFLDFTLEGNAEGWIAVGFSNTPSMASSDVLGCIRYGNGVLWVIDTWNPDSERTNALDDTQLDVCVHSVHYHDGRMQCTFSRTVTGATNETDLNLDGDYYLLFGSGGMLQNDTVSGGFTRHDETPQISLEPLNPVNDSIEGVATTRETLTAAAVEAMTKTHGVLMIIAWPILAKTAIYFSAFMKPVLSKKGEWYYIHGSFMLCSALLTSISLVLIFVAHIDSRVPGLVDLSLPLPLSHFIVGIVVAAGQQLNIMLALFRCKPAAKFRWIYNILHGKITGYITSLLSLVNIAIGIYLFCGYSVAFGLFIVVAILGVAMFEVLHLLYNVLPRLLKFCRKKDEEEESLLSISEKYNADEDDGKSVVGELKSVLAHIYRQHFGTFVLVLTVIVPINVAVCVFIAIH